MPSQALVERVRQVVANVFNQPLESVTPDSSPKTIEQWDSMGQLGLVLELEQEFGVMIEPEQAEQMGSVTQVADVLENQLNVKD